MTTTEKILFTIPLVSALLGCIYAPIGLALNLSLLPFLIAMTFTLFYAFVLLIAGTLYHVWKG